MTVIITRSGFSIVWSCGLKHTKNTVPKISKSNVMPSKNQGVQLETPIAFIIFNRPDTTARVFNEIKEVRPKKLFVVSDGARNKEEEKLVEETRKIIDQVDWDCEIYKNYSEKNLGCKIRVSSGIDWFFENVEQGIILEDDCLPSQSFFWFCEELLKRYSNSERVMHISGNFFQQKNKNFEYSESYYFSILPHIWGWATWRRAWRKYDVDMKRWPEIQKNGKLAHVFGNQGVYDHWAYTWNRYHKKMINSWDGQWAFACIAHNGISINPTVNLVSNIGFGNTATRTKEPTWVANLPISELAFPLVHPTEITINRDADAFTFRNVFNIDKKLLRRVIRPFKTAFPWFYQRTKQLFGRE